MRFFFDRLFDVKLSVRQVIVIALVAIACAVLLRPGNVKAQRVLSTPAQVNTGNPLPVYVVNDQLLPDGFIPGSTWRFTTWTTPSTLTFSATVQRTEGGWAYLTVNGTSPTGPRWYYVPQMPGAWEPQ